MLKLSVLRNQSAQRKGKLFTSCRNGFTAHAIDRKLPKKYLNRRRCGNKKGTECLRERVGCLIAKAKRVMFKPPFSIRENPALFPHFFA